MADAAPLSLPERQLANELALRLAVFMWEHRGHELVDGQIYNVGQSNYEGACRALNRVGVYKQGKHYTLHHVLVPVSDVPVHMAALEVVDRATFDDLLFHTFEYLIEYGTLPSSRQPFGVPEALHRFAMLLDRCGYAKWDGTHLQWTDKPASQMRAGSFWDESGASLDELKAQQIESAAQAMLDDMPDLLRRKVLKVLSGGDEFAAIAQIERHRSDAVGHLSGAGMPEGSAGAAQPAPDARTYKEAFRLLLEGAG